MLVWELRSTQMLSQRNYLVMSLWHLDIKYSWETAPIRQSLASLFLLLGVSKEGMVLCIGTNLSIPNRLHTLSLPFAPIVKVIMLKFTLRVATEVPKALNLANPTLCWHVDIYRYDHIYCNLLLYNTFTPLTFRQKWAGNIPLAH